MQVILLEDVEKLGKGGEVVKVKDGYGRNFLIPRGLALVLTKSNLKLYEDRKRREDIRLGKEKNKALELAQGLENISCTIAVQVGEGDRLYGSVTNQDIEKALRVEGFEIDKKQIEIDEPIKNLGVYTVRVRLHPEAVVPLKVWVVKE